MDFNENDFVMKLPHSFVLTREHTGANECYTLYSKERVKVIKTQEMTDSWKHCGYYSTIEKGLKAFLKKAPNKKLKGDVKVQEVVDFLEELRKEIEL